MKINLFEVQQPIGVFYIGVMAAETILKVTEVRSRKSGKGIQREASIKRIKEIGQYCHDLDATFPTPIIIALDDSPNITIKDCVLEFDEDKIIGEVIDGQHRLAGIEHSGLVKLFMLPVVVMFGLTQEEKAYVFSTINSTQTKVSKSLIYELFDLAEDRSPQKTSHEIARLMNSDESSPFYKRLKMLGTKEDDLSSLSQGTFVKYLMPLISKKPDEDLRLLKRNKKIQTDPNVPLREYFRKEQDETIYKIITNVFLALREVFPDEWENPNNYILSKTTGYGAVMKAFSNLYEIGMRQRKLSKSFFVECFTNFKSSLEEMNLELTSKNFGSNEQAINKLKRLIIDSQ